MVPDLLSLRSAQPSATGAGGASGNLLIDLLVGGARIFGKALSVLGELGKWALVILAAACFLLVLISVVLFFTARGIHAGRAWARILGILLAVGALLLLRRRHCRPAPPGPFDSILSDCGRFGVHHLGSRMAIRLTCPGASAQFLVLPCDSC